MSGRQWRLVGLVALAWVLLTWRLGERSLWIDEFTSLTMSRGSAATVVAAAAADFHPPLYFLGLRWWTALAGSSDLALRWPSAAAGVVAVALMAVVARQWGSPRAALPAAALLALAPAFVEFSRMARYYALVTALGLLALALLHAALRRGRWRRWLAYAAAVAALLFTFYPTLFLVPAHGLLAWRGTTASRRRLAAWATASAAGVAVFAALALNTALSQAAASARALPADFARSPVAFGLGIGAAAYTFSAGETLFPWNPAAWLALAGCGVLLAFGARRRAGARFWLALAVALGGITFVAALTTTVSTHTPFLNVPVRGLFLLPHYLLALALGFERLPTPRARWVVAALVLGGWAVGLANYYAGTQFLNPIYLTPSKTAAALVSTEASRSDLAIIDPDSLVGYYLVQNSAAPAQVSSFDLAAVEAALANRPPRVWLVTLGRDRTAATSTRDRLREQLNAGYGLSQTHQLLPIDPIYWRLKNRLLGRESYRHRLTIEEYQRRP